MMKKPFTLMLAAVFLAAWSIPAYAQEDTSSISQQSSQESLQNSLQQSSDQSTAQSSANSDTSFADSSRESSAQSSEESSASGGDTGTVILLVSGAVVAIGLTVGGIVLTVNASQVREEEVLRLQDQIYLADGDEYAELVAFFGLDDRTVGRIHDELVASGRPIASSQDAADFLAAFALRLAERSDRVKGLLSGG